jgi:hypothetical protein
MDALPPEALLEAYPENIRAVADRLRLLVAGAVPNSIERVRVGWRLIGYAVPFGRRTRYFAAIGPEARHCHLFFEYGAFMADPERRLEGAHLRLKRVRYLTFTSRDGIAAIGDEVIQRYVVLAARLAMMSREQRLVMSPGQEIA